MIKKKQLANGAGGKAQRCATRAGAQFLPGTLGRWDQAQDPEQGWDTFPDCRQILSSWNGAVAPGVGVLHRCEQIHAQPSPGDAASMLPVQGVAWGTHSAQPRHFRSRQHQMNIEEGLRDISQHRREPRLPVLITIYSPVQSPWPSIHPAWARLPLCNTAGRALTDPHPVFFPPQTPGCESHLRGARREL